MNKSGSFAARGLLAAGLLCLQLATASSCGPKQVPVDSPDLTAKIVGVLKVEGSTPFTRTLYLTESSGLSWTLEAPGWEGEIDLLAEQTLKLEGIPAPSESQPGLFIVTEYELIPAEGMIAHKGVIREGHDGLILRSDDGDSFLIIGPLAEVLTRFKEHLLWIWGVPIPGSSESDHLSIMVEGYEVLGGGG